MLTLRALVYAYRALRVDVRALGHEMIDLWLRLGSGLGFGLGLGLGKV